MINRIKLEHLVELMQSDSGPDRLVAEYIRLKQWYESIKEFNNRVEAGKYLERPVITPDTKIPYEMSKELQSNIGNLLHTMEVAAIIEDIDLEDAINYYIQKALKAEREYHGFTACEAGGAVEALPEDVMSLEDTLKTFEYCDMYCDGSEGVCAKCPNRNKEDPNECDGLTRMIKSGLFHLRRYVNN